MGQLCNMSPPSSLKSTLTYHINRKCIDHKMSIANCVHKYREIIKWEAGKIPRERVYLRSCTSMSGLLYQPFCHLHGINEYKYIYIIYIYINVYNGICIKHTGWSHHHGMVESLQSTKPLCFARCERLLALQVPNDQLSKKLFAMKTSWSKSPFCQTNNYPPGN